MAGKRNVTKAAYWQEMVARQASSGMTVREFCSSERVSAPSFYSWRCKLNGSPGKPARIRRRRTKDDEAAGPFIPLSLVDAPASMELLHPLGYRIRLTGDVSPMMLANVLDAIAGSPRR